MHPRTTPSRRLPRVVPLVAITVVAGIAAPSALAKPRETPATKAPTTTAHQRGPQLSAASLGSLPKGAKPGGTYTVKGTASNTGTTAAAGPMVVRLMRRGTTPKVIGTTKVRAAAKATTPFSATVSIPKGTTTGSYLVVACAERGGTSGVLGCITATKHLDVRKVAPVRGAKGQARAATSRAAETCSSGAHTLGQAGDHVYPEMGNGGYTSLHTDVNLIYEATTNTFLPGNNVVLTDKATQCLSDFSLDFAPTTADPVAGPNLTVGSITVNGQPATFKYVQPTYPSDPNGQDDPDPNAHAAGLDAVVGNGNTLPPACAPQGDDPALVNSQCPKTKLVITPTQPLASGTTFAVQVNYTGTPGQYTDGDGSTEGWLRSNTPANDGSFVTTEPVGTMAWMPLNNHPSAKPTYDFNEQTTLGRTVIANGELVGFGTKAADANFPAGSSTWKWHSPEPIANYLVENSIGAFDLSERLAGDGALYYEAQGSSITATKKAANKAIMDQQEDITAFQSRFNGPFPFSSNGVVIGIPSASFEEEMQTKITFAGGSISIGTFNHENMHQWWGDNVSEGDFNETFLKEGFAQLGEYLATARTAAVTAGGLDTPAGQTAFDARLVQQFNTNYANTGSYWTAAPSNPTAGTLFSTGPTYRRPGTTYLAVRQILGKDNFTSAMKAIQADYGGGNISEAQLIAEFHRFMPNQSATCSARLDTFFTQWFDTVYATGGGANKPQLTGPGLNASPAGTTFYDTAAGGCSATVPTTTATVSPAATGGHFTDPTVTLAATVPGGAPAVASTTYAVDGGAKATYTGPIQITGDGTHTVTYSSTDADGNVELTKTTTVDNATPPVTTASVLPAASGGTVVAPATVLLAATDDSSGVASTEYDLDGAGLVPYTGPITIATTGPHTVRFRSTDRLGAVETTKSLDLNVVAPPVVGPGTTTPPPTPAGPKTDPLSPAAALAILKKKVTGFYATASLKTLRFTDKLPEAGTVTYGLSIKVGKKTYSIGTSKRRVTATGAIVVTIKPSARGRRLLKAHPRTSLTLRSYFVSAVEGTHVNSVRTITRKK